MGEELCRFELHTASKPFAWLLQNQAVIQLSFSSREEWTEENCWHGGYV